MAVPLRMKHLIFGHFKELTYVQNKMDVNFNEFSPELVIYSETYTYIYIYTPIYILIYAHI